MLAWTLILCTMFPLCDMGRFQRRDTRKIEREERRVERKEVREMKRGLVDQRRALLNRHEP